MTAGGKRYIVRASWSPAMPRLAALHRALLSGPSDVGMGWRRVWSFSAGSSGAKEGEHGEHAAVGVG